LYLQAFTSAAALYNPLKYFDSCGSDDSKFLKKFAFVRKLPGHRADGVCPTNDSSDRELGRTSTCNAAKGRHCVGRRHKLRQQVRAEPKANAWFTRSRIGRKG
jgi:hypothetical protein